MHPFVVLVSMVRKDYEKLFIRTPNSAQETQSSKIILPSDIDSDLDKQLLVWGVTNFESPEPPPGLLDKILLTIRREQELRNTKCLAFGFLALLILSVASVPFSWASFSGEVASSGILQFISIALNDFGTFLALWPDSFMAVAESLPVMSLTLFAINMTLAVFTLRLFLHHKRTLIEYFLHGRQTNLISI